MAQNADRKREYGGPALGEADQACSLGVAELETACPNQIARLRAVKREVTRVEFYQRAGSSHPAKRKGRSGTRGDCEQHSCGESRRQRFEEGARLVALKHLDVVKHEHRGSPGASDCARE